ncbi:hypothetical protein GLOIN_2v1480335 [Rhizophagus clarus]|uniref:Uncharacterized protein n=1 Tax=Rhizophagus clarus TaxID=94130 RepID=A0A8H3KV03_9GLOM|nr:hypothetical protein GLOIN_2v1480335 [Rhizophagus clarus]
MLKQLICFFMTIPYVNNLGYAVYIIFDELVRKENTEDSKQFLNEKKFRKIQMVNKMVRKIKKINQEDKAKEKVPIKKCLKNSKSYKIVLLISLARAEFKVLKMVDF